MSYFDQYIQFRALKFKFDSMNTGLISIDQVEASIRGGSLHHSDDDGKTMRAAVLEEIFPVKNVCAKLGVPLVDRLDNTLSTLGISKREFIEMSLIEALDRVDKHLADVDAFEYIDRMQAIADSEQESK